MLKHYLNTLHTLSTRQTGFLYKALSLLSGGMIFLVLFPAVFLFAARVISRFIMFQRPVLLEWIVILLSIPLGLFFLLWATWSQWHIGGGTPAPNAPTQTLVINGPYKFCRNPIEFGAILYYLGVGTYFGSLTTGIISFLLGMMIGSSYHKFVEEKELEMRFGDAYRTYKHTTPFLFPGVRSSFFRRLFHR